jgi:hypothetical protein
VHFLFAVRRQAIGPAYLNLRLIPLLCRKANVASLDARGRITAHRARATLASALYNAPDGLTLDELGEWLGHKDLRSTQRYAKLHPTRLVRAVARASLQARLVCGLPALFYYLGGGSYCANPAWAPVRTGWPASGARCTSRRTWGRASRRAPACSGSYRRSRSRMRSGP